MKNSGGKVLSSLLLNRFVVTVSELALELDFYLLETVSFLMPSAYLSNYVSMLYSYYILLLSLSIVYLLCNTLSINSLYINLIYLFIGYK